MTHYTGVQHALDTIPELATDYYIDIDIRPGAFYARAASA